MQAQRFAAWLLRTLARGRQAGHLGRLLLLDTAGDGEAEPGAGGGLLYNSSRQADTASSVHRFALVLNTIDVEMEALINVILPAARKQQVLLQLLQSLPNKV
jgi:hypothetical protein